MQQGSPQSRKVDQLTGKESAAKRASGSARPATPPLSIRQTEPQHQIYVS
jgi:hypothetical protein